MKKMSQCLTVLYMISQQLHRNIHVLTEGGGKGKKKTASTQDKLVQSAVLKRVRGLQNCAELQIPATPPNHPRTGKKTKLQGVLGEYSWSGHTLWS